MKATRLLAMLVGAGIALAGAGCGRSDAPAAGAGAPPAASLQSGPPEQVLAAVLAERDPFARARQLAELLPTLGPDAVPAIRSQLTRSAILSGADFEMLVRRWAAHDPQGASTWAYGITVPSQAMIAVQTAVEEWARRDPAAARAATEAAIRKGVPSDIPWVGRVALMRGWLQHDRAGLEEYIHSFGVTAERESWIYAYALVLAQTQGSDALMSWARAVPADDEAYKRSANYQTAAMLAALDPPAARRWCDEQCDGPYAVGMRAAIVGTNLRNGEDAKPIVEWLAQAPAGPDKNQTLAAAYATWVKRNRDDALAWMRDKLSSATPEPWVPVLYAPYARNLAETAPTEAIEVAQRVEGAPEREALLIDVARTWRRKDAAAADAWLAGSPLSEAARESARNLDPSANRGPAPH